MKLHLEVSEGDDAGRQEKLSLIFCWAGTAILLLVAVFVLDLGNTSRVWLVATLLISGALYYFVLHHFGWFVGNQFGLFAGVARLIPGCEGRAVLWGV